MSLIKVLIIYIIFILGLTTLNSCSSSSGTLRYQDTKQNESASNKNNSRYTQNSNGDDSLFIYEDEDVPEFQDPSDLPEDESKIDLSSLMKNIGKNTSGSDGSVLSSKKEIMIMEIIKYMNTPYKYGGNSLNGIDCSAFTQNVYQSSWMLQLNRSARDQYQQGKVIEDRADLKFGDLIFFNTRRRVKPGHVGIYIGDNLFAHASSKLGVTISSLEHDYYNKRYMGARRIEDEEIK
jgi:cell wall-associated NlpC family hydrolase